MSARGCAGLLRHRGVQRAGRGHQWSARVSTGGGTVLGSRNLDHYILRCLIDSGQLHTRINALKIAMSHETSEDESSEPDSFPELVTILTLWHREFPATQKGLLHQGIVP